MTYARATDLTEDEWENPDEELEDWDDIDLEDDEDELWLDDDDF
jgi:hypothetical protein